MKLPRNPTILQSKLLKAKKDELASLEDQLEDSTCAAILHALRSYDGARCILQGIERINIGNSDVTIQLHFKNLDFFELLPSIT